MSIERYTLIQRLLHWSIALLVIGALIVGGSLDYIGNGAFKNQLYALHKATGMTILGLMAVRLLVRLTLGAPPLPDSIDSTQRFLATLTHWAFYVLLIAMALIGWAGTSAFPAPLPFFGLFEFPPLIGKDRELSKWLFELHHTIGLVLIALVLTHIGAALYHKYSLKDRIFERMWFGKS